VRLSTSRAGHFSQMAIAVRWPFQSDGHFSQMVRLESLDLNPLAAGKHFERGARRMWSWRACSHAAIR